MGICEKIRHCLPSFFFEEKMPVWATLVASLLAGGAAAFGTYFIAPKINEINQDTQTRHSHLTEATSTLNSEIIILSQNVRKLIESLEENSGKEKELKESCYDSIVKIQWLIIELKVLLENHNGNSLLDPFGSDVEELRRSIIEAKGVKGENDILLKMTPVATDASKILGELYKLAKLQ